MNVLVSLRAWSNDIKQPYTLDEVWVQISGVLPKWCNSISFKQIASSHSKIMEKDWNYFFDSFFEMVGSK
jgi:hypothetical protein